MISGSCMHRVVHLVHSIQYNDRLLFLILRVLFVAVVELQHVVLLFYTSAK